MARRAPRRTTNSGTRTRTKPRIWSDFEEAHAPGGAPVEATMSRARKAATRNTPMTPPPKKFRTATAVSTAVPSHRRPNSCQLEPCRIPETRNFWRFRNELVRLSQPWACSSTHPARHWPACFDQTRFPGEGPLTTLDSPDAQGMCLTPTQEIMTCDMVRRKTKEKRGEGTV